jgi:hypothetical protein
MRVGRDHCSGVLKLSYVNVTDLEARDQLGSCHEIPPAGGENGVRALFGGCDQCRDVAGWGKPAAASAGTGNGGVTAWPL